MKKANNKKNSKVTNAVYSDNEMFKLIKLVLIVLVIFAVFYFITVLVTKKDNKTTTEEKSYEAKIQYDKILVGNILDQKDNEYYVLVYKEDDLHLDMYNGYLNYYVTKEESVPYYTVNLSESFNKNYISEESNLKVNSNDEFKFKDTTLLRIKDKKVISTYEGSENITGKLNRMTGMNK